VLEDWFKENVNEKWPEYRQEAIDILVEDDRLQQIIKIMGEDVLPDDQKLTVLVARIIKVGVLQQNAFSEVDAFCPPEKQFRILKLIVDTYRSARKFIEKSIPVGKILPPEIVSKLSTLKESRNFEEEIVKTEKIIKDHFEQLEKLYATGTR